MLDIVEALLAVDESSIVDSLGARVNLVRMLGHVVVSGHREVGVEKVLTDPLTLRRVGELGQI